MSILDKLRGGDRRSIGRSDEVVEEILGNESIFPIVFDGMLHEDPLIRMRASDAITKATTQRPELIQPYKKKLIQHVSKIDQQEVQWHFAQLVPFLQLSHDEKLHVVDILKNFLSNKSRIVVVSSLQALTELSEDDTKLKPVVVELIQSAMSSGSPSIMSRGRKLLKRLG